jgi:hypothetical protein
VSNATFEGCWSRVVAHAGRTFRTKTGLEFTYKIDGAYFCPSRTDYRISREDFRKAFQMVPIDGPGVISRVVRGPAYVWAVLHDRRISLGQW